jgi:hypothetical protein
MGALNPSVYHTPLYRRVFADVEAVRLEPPGPWGLEGSRRWLREVAGAAGDREAMEQTLWGHRAIDRARDSP